MRVYVLFSEKNLYGVDIPKNVLHNVESTKLGSVFFECKEGAYAPLESEDNLVSTD